jgi:hypothetical protein
MADRGEPLLDAWRGELARAGLDPLQNSRKNAPPESLSKTRVFERDRPDRNNKREQFSRMGDAAQRKGSHGKVLQPCRSDKLIDVTRRRRGYRSLSEPSGE